MAISDTPADATRLALRTVGLVAAAIAAVALPSTIARPEAPRGADVAIVLDVSMSMRAGDIAPDRLTEARRQVLALLREAPPGRAAVVAFAGDARVICPLTLDLDAVAAAIASATSNTAAAGGSDIATALERAAELFGHSNARIVLITDGEAGPGDERDPLPVARALAERGIALTVIGVGTTQGATIPLRDDQAVPQTPPTEAASSEGSAKPHLSRLDRRRLMSLAEQAGGQYVHLEAGKVLLLAGLLGNATAPASGNASNGEPVGKFGDPVALDAWTRTGLLLLVSIGAILFDTALWWLRRSTNPWG